MNNLSNGTISNLAETLAGDLPSDWEREEPASSLYYSAICGVLFPLTAIGVLTLLTRL